MEHMGYMDPMGYDLPSSMNPINPLENVHDPGVPGYHQPREDALCALSCDEIFSNAMR